MQEIDPLNKFETATVPGIIDRNLLLSLVIEQGSKGEAKRLLLKDGIKLEEISEIRIEFLNILNIDNLWTMKNLVKLKLSNNIIENIINLETLIHLKELDLSFNKIKLIENLNTLNKLKILLLYSNEISSIDGLDNLLELRILNMGQNQITDRSHVLYLRQFKKLYSLNMKGNPCEEVEGYFDYLIALIPQLIYYKYKMISEEQRKYATSQHLRVINGLEEEEEIAQQELIKSKQFEEKIALQSKSYVEYLDGDLLFQQMFSHDIEGKGLSKINEDCQNAFDQCKDQFSDSCQGLYKIGLEEETKRQKEIEIFNQVVNERKQIELGEAQKLADEMIGQTTTIFETIKELLENIENEMDDEVLETKIGKIQHFSKEFDDLISKTWKKLMSQEMSLHEQIEDINETFQLNITEMVDSFLEVARGYFSQLRNFEAEYNDSINGIVSVYLSGFTEDDPVPKELTQLCENKDVFNNNLAASHDMHLQVIDAREDLLLNRIKDWLNNFVENLIQKEIERHRLKILEISHFLDYQRKEFEQLRLHQIYSDLENPESFEALEE